MNNQMYILAQEPVTPQGKVIPTFATSLDLAITEFETTLGKRLTRQGAGYYTDGTDRYFLYFGDKGLEQFAQLFEGRDTQ